MALVRVGMTHWVSDALQGEEDQRKSRSSKKVMIWGYRLEIRMKGKKLEANIYFLINEEIEKR